MLPPPDEKAIYFCILISNTFFEGSKYALPNLLFRKTSLIYTWSSFSLSPAGISGVCMAYLCVTCIPFNSQQKCFSTLDSTAWLSLMKAKQHLSALLIMRPKGCRSPACLPAKQELPEPSPTQFPLVWLNWSADKFHPDSKHSSASSVSRYFSLP